MQSTQELLAQEQQKKGELETALAKLKSDLSMKVDAGNYTLLVFLNFMQKVLRSQILKMASVPGYFHGPECKKLLISFLSVALRKQNVGNKTEFDALNCKLFFI